MMAENEEGLCRSKQQKNPRPLDPALDPIIVIHRLGPDLKELQAEHGVEPKPGDEQLPVSVPEPSAALSEKEELTLLHQENTEGVNICAETEVQTEFSTDSADDDDDDDDDDDTDTGQSPQKRAAPEINASVNSENTSTTDGAQRKKHQCSVCEKTFTRKYSLQTHSRIHTGERPYCCSICNQSFNQKGCLDLHLLKHTGQRSFTCSICNKSYFTKSHLDMHSMKHAATRPFSCSVCQKQFCRNCDLKLHMKRHTGEFSCSVCKKTFSTKSSLEKHGQIHAREQFTCSICQQTFKLKLFLKAHMRSHAEETSAQNDLSYPRIQEVRGNVPFQSLCRDFTGTAGIKQEPQEDVIKLENKQLSVSVPESSAVCEKRNESTLLQQTQTEPLKSVPETSASVSEGHASGSEGNKHQCPVCKKRFKNKSYITSHMRIHTGEKPFSCSICKKSFSLNFVMVNHMKTHEKKKEPTYSCPVCPQTFKLKLFLKSHMRTHTEEELRRSKDLDRVLYPRIQHVRGNVQVLSHYQDLMGTRTVKLVDEQLQVSVPEFSAVCEKRNESTLLQQTQTEPLKSAPETSASVSEGRASGSEQAAENKHQCPVCKKTFKSKSYIKCHMRIHTGEKPFSCSICKKSFALNFVMIKHMKTHERKKEPTYSCPVCPQTFKLKLFLKSHMRTHTEEELCRSKDLDRVLYPRIQHVRGNVQVLSQYQDLMGTRTVKEEPEERMVKLEDEQLQVSVCEKSDEPTLLQQTQTEHRSMQELQTSAPETNASVSEEHAAASEENKHQCPVCKKIFTTTHILINHIRVHTEERTFSCPVCKKIFALKSNMIAHAKAHERENRPSSSVTRTHTDEELFSKDVDQVPNLRIQHVRGNVNIQSLYQNLTVTAEIKQEPKEQNVKLEKEELPVTGLHLRPT